MIAALTGAEHFNAIKAENSLSGILCHRSGGGFLRGRDWLAAPLRPASLLPFLPGQERESPKGFSVLHCSFEMQYKALGAAVTNVAVPQNHFFESLKRNRQNWRLRCLWTYQQLALCFSTSSVMNFTRSMLPMEDISSEMPRISLPAKRSMSFSACSSSILMG